MNQGPVLHRSSLVGPSGLLPALCAALDGGGAATGVAAVHSARTERQRTTSPLEKVAPTPFYLPSTPSNNFLGKSKPGSQLTKRNLFCESDSQHHKVAIEEHRVGTNTLITST